MHEVRARAAERFDEGGGGRLGEADQVDDGIGAERGDPRSERAVAVLLLTVGGDALDPLPLGGVGVGVLVPRLMATTS
ncbi:hypothetical protein QP157_04490 [Sphingomonas sp. LR61]|uniref:hypothetical protein n=1 Tax=Sphingomonas sp. LR61 TaxID=3050234 RepID=UPI002FE2AF52